jgi:hypothetical protein
MNAVYTIINKSSDVLSFFGKSAQQMGNDGWYARWFIRAKGNSDAKQNIDLTNGGQTSNWAIAPDYDNGNWSTWLWVKDGNIVNVSTAIDGQAKNDWYVNRALCHSRIQIPNTYSKLSELSDYEIVYEAAANYTSGDPDITLRYVWKITPPVTFEYDGEIANTVAVTQQMTSATSSEETLDWTTPKASVAMPQTGWKYARFYVVDATGTAVDPTDNAHKLTVSGGTLCDTNESGYYVYNNGSDDITLPTVKLTSTGTVRPYKVVCWMATASTGVNMDGTTMTEEPDITHEYTYSFTYPVTHTEATGEVEWSPASMTVALDIDALKGVGMGDVRLLGHRRAVRVNSCRGIS